jgi:hypothetical protein
MSWYRSWLGLPALGSTVSTFYPRSPHPPLTCPSSRQLGAATRGRRYRLKMSDLVLTLTVKVVEPGPLRPTITVSSIVDRHPPIEAGGPDMPQTLFAQPAGARQPVDPAWAHGRAEALVLLLMSTVDGYEASGPLAGSAIWHTKISAPSARCLPGRVQLGPTGTYTIPAISPRTWPIQFMDGSERFGHEPTNSRSTFGARRAGERKVAARRAASTTTRVGRRAGRPSGWAVVN